MCLCFFHFLNSHLFALLFAVCFLKKERKTAWKQGVSGEEMGEDVGGETMTRILRKFSIKIK